MTQAAPIRVAILCGGRSHERAVSLRTGARVEHALAASDAHETTLIDVGADIETVLRESAFDVAFIALHGRGGEDDVIQELCEQLELPYTHSRRGPAGAAFHKARAKRLLLAADLPTPPFITFSEHAIEQFGAGDVRDEVAELGYPVVVKPAQSGSSLGTHFVEEAATLPRALIGAMSYDSEVLIERFVQGRELSVTVLGVGAGAHDDADGLRVLPAVEIVPRHADWFDYESRYVHGETEFTCPPEGLDDAVLERVSTVARAACIALDVAGVARVDVMVDEQDAPWVLEVSPVPGMTETSLVSVSLDAAGISLTELVIALIDDAFSRAREDRDAADA